MALSPCELFPERPNFPEGLRVLLVDPKPVDREVAAAKLEGLRYDVTSSSSLDKALQLLESGSYDIVLADASALSSAITEKLNRALSKTSLIIMSVQPTPEQITKGVDLGAVDILDKPLNSLKLQTIWQHAVRRNLLAPPTKVEGAGSPPSSCTNLIVGLNSDAGSGLGVEVSGSLEPSSPGQVQEAVKATNNSSPNGGVSKESLNEKNKSRKRPRECSSSSALKLAPLAVKPTQNTGKPALCTVPGGQVGLSQPMMFPTWLPGFPTGPMPAMAMRVPRPCVPVPMPMPPMMPPIMPMMSPMMPNPMGLFTGMGVPAMFPFMPAFTPPVPGMMFNNNCSVQSPMVPPTMTERPAAPSNTSDSGDSIHISEPGAAASGTVAVQEGSPAPSQAQKKDNIPPLPADKNDVAELAVKDIPWPAGDLGEVALFDDDRMDSMFSDADAFFDSTFDTIEAWDSHTDFTWKRTASFGDLINDFLSTCPPAS